MQVYESNLSAALSVAIAERRKVEAQLGYTGDSAFVAGLVQVLEAFERGEHIEIVRGA